MFEIIKSAISAGGYKLTDILQKIKKLYVLGDLTEEQMEELINMASGGISVDAERPEMLAMIQTLAGEIEALRNRVKALEGEVSAPPAYPLWKAWDGISGDYQPGAVVSHNGELWESVFDGQNVWEPGTAGTEALWVKHTPAK